MGDVDPKIAVWVFSNCIRGLQGNYWKMDPIERLTGSLCYDWYQIQFQMKLPEVLFNMDNTQFIKVWDIAIRVFHWTLVGCYALAFISSENISKLHILFGYSVLFLVLFCILYGFVGSKYAKFSDFLYCLSQIADYLKGLLIGRWPFNNCIKPHRDMFPAPA